MDEQQQGRELDAAVAEKVMGWTINKERAPYRWNVPLDQTAFREWDGDHLFTTPSFTTDPSDAWQVVEKMRADGWGVDLFAGFCGDNRWQCELGHPSDKSRDVMAEGETMPLAICRAALAAKGGSREA